MPAGREGKRAAPFYIALPPLNFHGAGGKGERVSVDIYTRRRRFWYMHASYVGRMSILNFSLFACAFQFSLTRGRCFRGICTIGGGVSGGFIPLRGEGKRAAPFPFALPPLKFHGSGERGGVGFGGSLPSAAAFGFYMPAYREGERTELCFCACAVRFSRTGGRCFW